MSTQPIILCPGQGAQFVGMARAWHETSAAARDVLEHASTRLGNRLGAPLLELCFNGPEARLNRTDVAQPAIFAAAVASFRALFADRAPSDFSAMAGFSLGEYTALHLAGAIEFEDALELVALRGRVMQEAAERSSGSMVALIGADESQARDLAHRAAQGQVLVPANFNAPGQIVLSGHAEACARAVALAPDLGLRAAALAVAGAFHSPLMQPAADALAEALRATPLRAALCRVLANVDAAPYPSGSAAEQAIRDRLVRQLVEPVRWSESCAALAAESADADFHELAPGKVLSGLMRRINRSAKVTTHDEPA